VIEFSNISVNYRSGDKIIPALSSLSLTIETGEYLSILGPNGSGKSTLVKALCGLVPPSNGEIKINGQKVIRDGFTDSFFGKVGVVFQEPSGQFLMPTVIKEIESPLQNLGLSHPSQHRKFLEIVDRFGLRDLLDMSPEDLSPGQMQIVNLAVAFSIGSEFLILDEPTTFLDSKYRNLLLEYIEQANRDGITVIHITQYPDEALRAKRTAIIDKGGIAADGDSHGILSDVKLLGKYRLSLPRQVEFKKHFGFGINDSYAIDKFVNSLDNIAGPDSSSVEDRRSVVIARNLSYSYTNGGFSLEIDKINLFENQIAGLVGPSGSGKSTLALIMAGILKTKDGTVKYYGSRLSDSKQYREKIGISWQMPDPVLIGPTVADDLKLNPSGVTGNADIGFLLENVGLAGFENRIVDTLSGGEKRKLSLASVLSGNPEYLILDEPAAFLDPVSQLELKDTIRNILRDLKGALIISHDLHFLSDLAGRIIGLNDGKVTLDLSAEEFFSKPEYSRAIDLDVDEMITFRDRLAKSGLEISSNSLDPRMIKEHLTDSRRKPDNFA
jgi:energy-coupling factor transporter ATP-binding protein EcfA2